MTTDGYIIIGDCECLTCGRAYDFEASGADCSDECPECAAKEEAEARAEEAREEAIADAQGELDEAESDLEGLLEELRDVKERIAATRRAIKAARRKLERLGAAG
jgi:septal ring factor EnvC (AmiA/AmiB activator)